MSSYLYHKGIWLTDPCIKMIAKMSMSWTPKRYFSQPFSGLPFSLSTGFPVVAASSYWALSHLNLHNSSVRSLLAWVLSLLSDRLKETEGPFQNVCLRAVPFPYRHISDFSLSSKLGSQSVPWLPRVTICRLASQCFLALCLSHTLTSRERSH